MSFTISEQEWHQLQQVRKLLDSILGSNGAGLAANAPLPDMVPNRTKRAKSRRDECLAEIVKTFGPSINRYL